MPKSPERQQDQEKEPALPIEEESNLIPAQYIGMPSEVVEELWQNQIFVDAEKNQAEVERRRVALEAIRKNEEDRETEKEEVLTERYGALSEDQRVKFPDAQKDATHVLIEHIQGNRDVDHLLSEEAFVLDKLRAAYAEYKEKNPDQQFSFKFAKGIDNSVYDNLVQRLSFKVLESRQDVDNQEAANDILRGAGAPAPQIETDGLLLPNKEDKLKTESIEDGDYEKFRVKNGETDIGVFWHEYGNVAAKKLKESGKLEWGKERIYFDIPLDDMEGLRDLAFDVAKSEKIPIAFKHLDIQKTDKVDLRQDSETTRFVTNFASIEDAKRFYQALQAREEYNQMRSDRDLDYHGFNIDGVAHYASGFREKRGPLKRIIETAKKNSAGTYDYLAASGKPINITNELYDNFVDQYNAMPDPKDAWERASV
jgi:hypothetical protein